MATRCILLLLMFLWPMPALGAEPPVRRPNFVIIMADDLGYGDLSSYGGWIPTPHLDALARSGLRFTDLHSSGNVCSPTRAGLLTGRYQQRAGIPGVVFADPSRPVHHDGLQPSEFTLAEALHGAGYATGLFGKWHLGYDPRYNPVQHGFDRFVGYVSGNIDFFSHIDQAGNRDWWHQDRLHDEAGYTTHLITRYAVDFIEAHRQEPFFLYLPHEAPHYPYQGPQDAPLRSAGGQFNRVGERTDVRNAYREMVQEMDLGIGEVVAALDRFGLLEHTLIWFCSDNGANQRGSNRPLRGFKGSDWEGGHRVPGIVSWRGRVTAGRTTDALAITLDIMPTLMALAGVQLPEHLKLDGIDLAPLLLAEEPPAERRLFWNGTAVRDGQWKLIIDAPGQPGVGLYDLSQDVAERYNLAQDQPRRVEALRAALQQWQHDVQQGATPQPSQQR